MNLAKIVFEPDIVYGTGGGRGLALDMLRPRDLAGDPKPAVMWVHGGGWRGGERAPSPNAPLAARGFVTMSASYRLSGEANFPAQIHDIKAAIRFVRSNASRWNIDPSRIGIWGHSAGGHLAALAALTPGIPELEGEGGHPGVSSAVHAAVPLSAPADLMADWAAQSPFPPHPEWEVLPQFLGGDLDDPAIRERARQASPVVYAHAAAPPMLVVHGARDDLVPVEQARALVARLRAAGAAVTCEEIPEDGHDLLSVFGEDDGATTAMMGRIVGFFAESIGPVPVGA